MLPHPGTGFFTASTEYQVVAIDLPAARRLAYSVVLGQAIVTVVAAAVSYGLAGPSGALSALLGGGISTLATLVMVALAFRRAVMADGQRIVSAFYAGEAAKLAVVVVLFVVVLKTMRVEPLPMLGAYIATFIVHWIVLARMVRAGK